MVTEDQVLGATADMNAKGVDLPIKDGLEIGEPENLEQDMPGDITSDEESELPGTARPRKGAGWWGQGPALKATRKGVPREFVDGAAYARPGDGPLTSGYFLTTTPPEDSRKPCWLGWSGS